MLSDSRRSLSGSLLRCGAGLIAIAIGLRWIVDVIRSAWMWLVGGLVVVAVIIVLAAWWRNRNLW